MFSQKALIATAAFITLLVSGCAVSETYSEESLGLRKTNLYSEEKTVADPTSYSKAAPGESKVYERAFENAPPMISHDVEGMLPITMENNSCLGCHDPAVAQSVGATSIPKSHLASFRPITEVGSDGKIIIEGKEVANTSDVLTAMHKRDGVSMERYNCSACHAPQSNNAPLVENTFTPEFRAENGAKRSNLLDTLNEGVQ
ncbi:MAG TPA: nitrate reductase [Sulfurospirillum sp. UBA11407]|jgi:cytochrome c-type protein NapB|nr:MAG TPA: nitrate reductase [Sulfurospirillum sp. UBA11407]DAB34333.1 MAG TPA: nitrate reductase [Sulfurospirillum sp. UBA12182]